MKNLNCGNVNIMVWIKIMRDVHVLEHDSL